MSELKCDASIDYANDNRVAKIGNKNTICQYCQEIKWPFEASELWCVILDEIAEPSEPLKSRLVGGTHFKVFLDNIMV